MNREALATHRLDALSLDSRAFQWFLRLWAIAAFAHFVGNPPALRTGQVPLELTLVALVTALSALAVMVKPHLRGPVFALSVLEIATTLLEAPIVGNHQMIASLVSVVLLWAVFQKDPWAAFAPGGRGLILVGYGFAAFSKLNSGFFDPTTSCAVTYGNRWLQSFHLPTLAPGSALALVPIWMTAVVELAVPLLLLVPPTRRWGVGLAFVFHFFVSLDFRQHLYDFSALLFALFSLFLPDVVLLQLGQLPKPRPLRPLWLALGTLASVFVAAALLPPSRGSHWLLLDGPFLVWGPWATWLLARTLLAVVRLGPEQPLGRPTPLAWAVIALAFLNGLAPYLELKTASSFNMYANLVTANGASNHFLIPRTAHLTDTQAEPYLVLSTTDEGLEQYVDAGWAIPRERLLDYLAQHPDAGVTVARLGREREERLSGAQDGVRLSWWKERFQVFRSVDVGSPARCQLQWLPAY